MPRRRIRARFYVLIGLVVLVVAGVVLFQVWINQPGIGTRATNPVSNHPYNILLIGNNARNATGPLSLGTAAGLADILMVVHIDPTKHLVTLISIPRDTLYALPGWKDPIPKIKETLFLGLQESPLRGPQFAMQSVAKLTGMPISAYVVTDFQGFEDAINAVGGIDIYIPATLIDPVHSGANFQKGLQHLTGAQALAFIRIRQNTAGNGYRTNDFQRMGAEQQVLLALKEKLLKSPVNAAIHLPALLAAWRQDVATNLSNQQLLQVGLMAAHSRIVRTTIGSISDSMVLAPMPMPGFNVSNSILGAYYDVLNAADITAELRPYGSTGAWTGLPPFPAAKDVPVTVIGSTYYASLLRQKGFPVTQGATSCGCKAVSVTFPTGQQPVGAFEVAKVVGNSNAYVTPGNVTQVTVQAP